MPDGLRILITSGSVVDRAENAHSPFALAAGLLARGHAAAIYAPLRRDDAADREVAVPVVKDLAAHAGCPDVIHGAHHVDTMTALLHFPGVPALFVRRGRDAWLETPPRFPRLHRVVDADGDLTIDTLVSLYRDVIDRQARGDAIHPDSEGRAAAAYLQALKTDLIVPPAPALWLRRYIQRVPVLSRSAGACARVLVRWLSA
jgi:hypothetical protein